VNFVAPDPKMIRRSECGCYLIEKVPLEGTDANGAQRHKYVLWEYYRTQWSFETAQDAADEARSLEDQAIQVWARLKAAQGAEPPPAAASSTPESAPRPRADGTEQTPPA
jgi:hypothetical protein